MLPIGRIPLEPVMLAGLAVLVCGATTHPLDAAGTRPTNILFIHMEDMGVQIPAYGDHTVATPNLSRLAAEGLVFERAHVAAATCAASRGALFSGLHPHQNGIMGFIDSHGFHYREGLNTFIHALKGKGYQCGLTYKTGVKPDPPFDFKPGYKQNRLTGGSNEHLVNNSIDNFRFFLQGLEEGTPFYFQAQTPDTHSQWERPDFIKSGSAGWPYPDVDLAKVRPFAWLGGDFPMSAKFRKEIGTYYRAIQRVDWFVGGILALLEEFVDRELYDLSQGAAETRNLAADPKHRAALETCQNTSEQGYPALRTALGGKRAFLKGADISLLQAIEDHGGVYKEDGKAKDPLAIFRDHGCNAMRIRLFHSPTGTPPRVNDLEYTKKLGRRIKDAGMQLLLDIHYSDTWADPGKQTKPDAWKDLGFDELERAVFRYTRDLMKEMRGAGAPPDIVQIGNEIGPGMLWPSGRVGGKGFNNPEQWNKLARLLKAGIAGVNADAGKAPARTMIHIHCGGNAAQTKWFFDNLVSREVKFDLIGLSYYPWWHSDGRGLQPLRDNLEATITRFGKDVVVVETAYPWMPNGHDPASIMHRGQPRPLVPGLPASPENQRVYLEEMLKAVRGAPDNKGLGLFYWAPEYIPAPRLRPGRGHLSLFDQEGNALPGISAFRER